MPLFNQKNIVFISGVILLLLASVYLLVAGDGEENTTSPQPNVPTVTTFPTIINPGSSIPGPSSIPTIPPGEGLGVDINSPVVKSSQAEIQKTYPLLPYSNTYVLSTGLEVSILIPQQEFQDNPWTLLIQIFGIDYQAQSTDENYELMKDSFREAANDALSFLQRNGADTSKIIVVWGDKEYIQKSASSWLKEP